MDRRFRLSRASSLLHLVLFARPVSLHDCTQNGAPQFTGTVRDVATRTARQEFSHQDSSSSFAQRCRFSIARGSIRGRRTSLSGAGVTEAIAGAINTQAASNVVAMIRLQKFLAARLIRASLRTTSEVFMVVSLLTQIPALRRFPSGNFWPLAGWRGTCRRGGATFGRFGQARRCLPLCS